MRTVAPPALPTVTPAADPATAPRDAVRLRDGRAHRRADRLAVEAPIEIHVAPGLTTVLLRTPGDDRELVSGFLFAEGILERAEELVGLRLEPAGGGVDGTVARVALAATALARIRREGRPLGGDNARGGEGAGLVALATAGARPAERAFAASAACGACGKTSLAALAVRAPRIDARLAVEATVLASLPARMRAAQAGFDLTGGLHAAALFRPEGTLLALREDVGRHNAVDKLVGWALTTRALPLADCVLQVSGRLGYEIVQKAIVAGIPVVAAVGAGSTLAIELGERFGQTLATFVREDGMNLFGDLERVTGSAIAATGEGSHG